MDKKIRRNFDLLNNIEITDSYGGITHKESVVVNFNVLAYRYKSDNHPIDKSLLKTEVARLSAEDIKHLIETNAWGEIVLAILNEALAEKKIKK